MKILAAMMLGLALGAGAAQAAAELFVAPEGAAGDGSRARPFTTLEQARDAVRTIKKSGALPVGGITVWLQPGIYHRAQTLALTAEDSGTAAAPGRGPRESPPRPRVPPH